MPTRDIASVIGRRLGVPLVSKAPEEANEHFGFLGWLFSRNVPASAERTREQFGWRPAEPGLIADLDGDHYFAAVTRPEAR